jgi:putative flippase GtrA
MKAFYDRFRDLISEAGRFCVVGLAGVVITDGGANLLRYGAGLDRFTAVAIATLAAVAISFVASRYWTFRHREHGGLGRETVLFCVANGIGIAISEGCVWLASAFGWEGRLSYNTALAGGIALATLFRYWSYKKWVWPRSRSVVAEQARERSLVVCSVLGSHAVPQRPSVDRLEADSPQALGGPGGGLTPGRDVLVEQVQVVV